jgi:hypothetical protein
MTPEQRAKAAQHLLDNPIWKEAWISLQKDMFADFCECCDLQTRERISLAMDLLSDFRAQVERNITEQIPLKIVGDNHGD